MAAHPFYHARSSAKLFGGVATDYYDLHTFFDKTKACVPTNLHRLVLHNEFGIELCEQVYGETFHRPSDGQMLPTYNVACQHVTEDFGFIPTLSRCMQTHPLRQEVPDTVFLTQEEQATYLAQKLGGIPEDYQELVEWFGRPGELLHDSHFFRLLGNSFGIFLAEARFGIALTRYSDQKPLPTRYVAENLVYIMLNSIPTLSHFFRGMNIEPWMCKGARRLSDEFEKHDE